MTGVGNKKGMLKVIFKPRKDFSQTVIPKDILPSLQQHDLRTELV
jgi:hypothetical protein